MRSGPILRPRLAFILVAAILFSMGLLMVYDTSSADILDRSLDAQLHFATCRQLLFAAVGALFAFVVYSVGYQRWLELAPALLIVTSVLLLLVFLPVVGLSRNGAHRWIHLGPFTVQPSELAKLALPLYYIRELSKAESITLRSFVKVMGVIAVPTALILLEPDNATTGIIGMTFLVLFFLTKVPFRFWLLPLIAFCLIGGAVAMQLPYVTGRIQVYLHPELDLQGRGHQPYQAKIAAGSGGLTGKGLGESLQKLTYLPEAQNDYIAAIFAEEFGFVGVVGLILFYSLLLVWGYQIAMLAPDKGGYYVAASLTFLIGVQAFLNLAVVSGLIPSTGLNLPLFSQGGTSLVANFIAIGLLLSVDRRRALVCRAS